MDISEVKQGDIIEHILSKDWLLVLEVDGNMVECRTKSLDIKEFYDFELRQRKESEK